MQGWVEQEAENQFSGVYRKSKTYLFLKRVMDVCASLAALIVLSPVFLLVAIVVYVNAPGPVIYGHLRIGRINKPFRMWKFRSMCMGTGKMID